MDRIKKVSFVIPCYRSEHTLPHVVTEIREKMQELTANTTEAAQEKHLPVIAVNENLVTVTVGETAHPMAEEHSIQWIYLQTKKGGQRKALKPGEAPKAVFALAEDEPVAAYAYCNLHGLWKTEI